MSSAVVRSDRNRETGGWKIRPFDSIGEWPSPDVFTLPPVGEPAQQIRTAQIAFTTTPTPAAYSSMYPVVLPAASQTSSLTYEVVDLATMKHCPLPSLDIVSSAEGRSPTYTILTMHRASPESAFEELDARRAENARRIAKAAPESLVENLGFAVRDRLLELINCIRDEDPEATSPSPESASDLVLLLARIRAVKVPSITLGADGLFWARWRRAANCYATLRFLGSGIVAYALSTPDPRIPQRSLAASGRSPLASVGDIIHAHPDLRWILGLSST